MGLLDWLFGKRRKSNSSHETRVSIGMSGKPARNDDDYTPDWKYYDVPFGKDRRPSGMVTLAGATDITVAGTSFRYDACSEFIKGGVRGLRRSEGRTNVELQRQPDNPGHPNSIMVWGILPGGQRFHIGYVPTEVSGRIAENWSPEMPIAAELRRFGRHRTDNAVFFSMNILVPGAAVRRKFEKAG